MLRNAYCACYVLAALLSACHDSEPTTSPTQGISAARAPATLRWQAVSAGYRFTCGIATSVTTSNRAYCWGGNEFGELGTGTELISTSVPTPVHFWETNSQSFSFFTSISSGDDFACGIAQSGSRQSAPKSAFCWGYNGAGRLGINEHPLVVDHVLAPVPIIGGELFSEVSAGPYAACGVRRLAAGALGQGTFCWGLADWGQAGDGGAFNGYLQPTQIVGNQAPTHLAHGWGHVCGLNPALYCWGFNSNGQLGDGTRENRTTATFIPGTPNLVTVTAGTYHTCGLTKQGQAFCWGRNDAGQLGLGTSGADQLVPTAIPGLVFTAISAGGFHTCGVAKTGDAYCWGYGGTGEIGNGSFASTSTPTLVSGGLKVTSITANGDGHNCAVTARDQFLYCWGNNDAGQLGTGTSGGNLAVPTRVSESPLQ